jgi:hypothetical protein
VLKSANVPLVGDDGEATWDEIVSGEAVLDLDDVSDISKVIDVFLEDNAHVCSSV